MEEPWPRPALALREAISSHVHRHSVGKTKYGERLLEIARALNTSAAPMPGEEFCATLRWRPTLSGEYKKALGVNAGVVEKAHAQLDVQWKLAHGAFKMIQRRASNTANNPARTDAVIRTSNAKRTKAQIAASNAKSKALKKATRAKQRQKKYDEYHAKVKQLRKDAAAAQPLGAIDGSGACKCPAHVFCNKCPAVKQARGRSEAEDLERRFHASTNVGCGMELADADLEDLIKQWIHVPDERKVDLTNAYNDRLGLGVPLGACAGCGLRDCTGKYYRHKVAELPNALKVGGVALARWNALDQTIPLVSKAPSDPPRNVNLRQIVSCYADCCGKHGADCQCGCAPLPSAVEPAMRAAPQRAARAMLQRERRGELGTVPPLALRSPIRRRPTGHLWGRPVARFLVGST